MLTVIPAIDVLDGKVVRLRQGDYESARFYDEPVLDLAFRYQEAGFKSLHLVNLSGARDLKTQLYRLIEQLHIHCKLTLQIGGGIRSRDDIERLIDLGVRRLVIGTLVIENKQLFERIISDFPELTAIAALDVFKNTVRSNAWQTDTHLRLDDLIPSLIDMGIDEYLITDISNDGMLNGINPDFYQRIRKRFPEIKLIASGGVSSRNDMEILDRMGIDACVIGKALIEKRLRVPKQYQGLLHVN
ncbi:MAG: 1-(5-phosphoribosyl)-5-[(5-phosphoribosylamino)methylideneamino] imidazole-4-carboxamide isomerase [Calditrichaeota bacterium]|nr:1-(5-phosphoribosyl)-5-[(5-phosphoribosylamino)methylideneamino] imidazole-4-carboxamide isomerase [Calditrichota bacterium]